MDASAPFLKQTEGKGKTDQRDKWINLHVLFFFF